MPNMTPKRLRGLKRNSVKGHLKAFTSLIDIHCKEDYLFPYEKEILLSIRKKIEELKDRWIPVKS